MPRSARLDAPGTLHHIMIRGIERRQIFRDDADREDFLSRLEKLLPVTGISCFAWALIPNHAHFLFRTSNVPIATLMRRLLTGYAIYFNHRHRRSGQLFQNRYKSILCQEETYLLELVRYIHLNPLRARLVKSLHALNTYPYGGHSVLMGEKRRDWQNSEYVLSYFGKQRYSAKKHYYAFMSEGVEQGHRDDLTGGGLIRSLGGWSAVRRGALKGSQVKSDERILGDGDFVDSMLSEADEQFDRFYALKRRGYDLDKAAGRAADVTGVEISGIFSRSRQKDRVTARSLFCYWASRELGISHTELARRLEISLPAISYAVERGERIAKEKQYRLLD